MGSGPRFLPRHFFFAWGWLAPLTGLADWVLTHWLVNSVSTNSLEWGLIYDGKGWLISLVNVLDLITCGIFIVLVFASISRGRWGGIIQAMLGLFAVLCANLEWFSY